MISAGIARNRNAENRISILAHRRSKLTRRISFQEIRTATVHVSRLISANRRHASRKYATIEMRILYISIRVIPPDWSRANKVFSRCLVSTMERRIIEFPFEIAARFWTPWLSRIRIVSRNVYITIVATFVPTSVTFPLTSYDAAYDTVGKETRIILI